MKEFLNAMNPFSKDSDFVMSCCSIVLLVLIGSIIWGAVYVTEVLCFENQVETIYSKDSLKYIGSENIYWSYWETSDGDTVAVRNEHQVHLHTGWCLELYCNSTYIVCDSVVSVPVKLYKDPIPHTVNQFKWKREYCWNW